MLRARKREARRRHLLARALHVMQIPGFGVTLVLALLVATGFAGIMLGGQYRAFVADYGDVRDVMARAVGLGIKAVTITGQKELETKEILEAAGVTPRNSLVFADVDDMRAGLLRAPLIKDATVRKLYPDQIVIALTEREPFAVWQRDGNVQVVAADGTPIDTLRDERYLSLPFVVGEGANAHISQYLSLLDASGDLRSKIRAGMWVGNRRWDIKLISGLEIKLPELGAEDALREFVRLSRDNRILDKDLLSVDLRMPGRVVARLSEDAAAARAESLSRKKGKGGA